MEYRYWLEFSDVAVIGAVYVPAEAVEVEETKENATDAKPVVASAVVGQAVTGEHDITGEWEVIPATATGCYKHAQPNNGTALTTVTKNGPVVNFAGLLPARTAVGRCLGMNPAPYAAPAQREGTNTYKVRIAGATVTLAAFSADKLTCEKVGDAITGWETRSASGMCTLRRKPDPRSLRYKALAAKKEPSLDELVVQHGRAAVANLAKPVYV
jgi:hypothetical protein